MVLNQKLTMRKRDADGRRGLEACTWCPGCLERARWATPGLRSQETFAHRTRDRFLARDLSELGFEEGSGPSRRSSGEQHPTENQQFREQQPGQGGR